ncbi:substrate-binding domain-containing protein [Aromatoleum evansii]|uniref:substrate-binding domain-containing protein n=1 Tax=Aromatoleum evansii TaxID=59406 RepID=UPI00145EB235
MRRNICHSLAPFATPPLTTVRSDPIGHGRLAVKMLLSQIHTRDHPIEGADESPAPLVIRESCGARTAPGKGG